MYLNLVLIIITNIIVTKTWFYRITDLNYMLPILFFLWLFTIILVYKKNIFYSFIFMLIYLEISGLFYTFVLYKPNDDIDIDMFLTTFNNSPRNKSYKWIHDYNVSIIYNKYQPFLTKKERNLEFALLLDDMYLRYSDQILLLEDDAIPFISDWAQRITSFQDIDVVFLDHRSYFTSHFSYVTYITGGCGMLFKREKLNIVSHYIRNHNKIDTYVWDQILSVGCWDNVFTCKQAPLFVESGFNSFYNH